MPCQETISSPGDLLQELNSPRALLSERGEEGGADRRSGIIEEREKRVL